MARNPGAALQGLLTALPLFAALSLAPNAQAAQDVEHYQLEIEVNPQSLYLKGIAALTIANTPGSASLPALTFQLKGYAISSLRWQGQSVPSQYDDTTHTHTVTLATPLVAGDRGQLELVYEGTPTPYVTEQGDLGIMQGRGITYAINVTDGAHYWFPCVDRLDDRATVDLALIVPRGNLSAGPGHLEQVTELDPGKERHIWQMKQPIAPYLIAFAFSDRFVQQRYDMPLATGPKATDLALLSETWSTASAAQALLPQMLDVLEARYGRFPYDRIGFHEIPFPGAVEQPGNIAMGSFYWTGQDAVTQYFMHELSHTWFQGKVGIRTWNDVFLDESIAVWHELLWIETSLGVDAADTTAKTNLDAYRVGVASEGSFALSQPTVLFGYTVYFKGSLVWRLLDHLLGREGMAALQRSYLADADGVSDLSDFRALLLATGNPDVANFSAEWIDRAGLPAYRFGWKAATGANGTSVALRLNQAREPYYFTPIDVAIVYPDGTTETRTLRPTSEDFVSELCLSQAPSSIALDPRMLVPRSQDSSITAAQSAICEDPAPSCGSRSLPSPAMLPLAILGLLWVGLRRRASTHERQALSTDS